MNFGNLPVEFYIVAGVLFIMLAVCLRLLTKLTADAEPVAVSATPLQARTPAAQPAQGGLELIAVISAAVSSMLEEEGEDAGAYTVKSITRAQAKPAGQHNSRAAWGFAGVMQNTRPF